MSANPLSILQPGTGLFNTHVTLFDVNKAIKEQMSTESELTAESKMEVIGDGNGFSSRVLLISCNWTIPSAHLPKKLILKIVSFVHIQALIDKGKQQNASLITKEVEEQMYAYFESSCKKMHNQEMNFYEVAGKFNSKTLLIPKVYFYTKLDEKNSNKGFIGMEYVEGSIVRHSYDTCTIEEIQPILRAIAKLQALSLQNPAEISKDLQKIDNGAIFQETLKMMLSESGIKGIFEQCRNLERSRFGEKVDRIEEKRNEILDFEKAFNLNKVVGIKQNVLCHGDLWAANFLWTENNGVFCATRIVDYQMSHLGNPAEDLVRLLVSTITGADRQAHWQQILEQFYSYFLNELGSGEAPYTLEQLKLSFKLYFPVGALALLPLFGPAVDAKLEGMDSEKAEKCRHVVIEKVACLLDDLEKYHKFSKRYFQEK